MRNTSKRRAMASIALAALLSAQGAWAVCRTEPVLVDLQRAVAEKHFPKLLAKLPAILGCDSASDFSANAVGDFSPDQWRVRVLRTETSLAPRIIVAHELGHAQVAFEGGSDTPFKGHGESWLRAMRRAGFDAEARRTASLSTYYPGLLSVYQQMASSERPSRKHKEEVDLLALLNERPSFLNMLLKPID